MLLYQEDQITISGGINMPQINILLVEDDRHNATALIALLDDVEFNITVAISFAQALATLHRQAVDIILLDLNLPDSKGVDTLRTISRQFSQIPIIVLTGIMDEDIVSQAAQEGAISFMQKTEVTKPGIITAIDFAMEKQKVINHLIDSRDKLRAAVETLSKSSKIITQAAGGNEGRT